MHMLLSLCVWFMWSFSSSQEDGVREGRTTTPPPLSPDPLISSLRLQTPCHRFWQVQPLAVSAARATSKTRAVCLSSLIPFSLKKINKNTDSISKRDEPSTWLVLKHALLWEPTEQAGSLLNKTREGGNYASWHAFLMPLTVNNCFFVLWKKRWHFVLLEQATVWQEALLTEMLLHWQPKKKTHTRDVKCVMR